MLNIRVNTFPNDERRLFGPGLKLESVRRYSKYDCCQDGINSPLGGVFRGLDDDDRVVLASVPRRVVLKVDASRNIKGKLFIRKGRPAYPSSNLMAPISSLWNLVHRLPSVLHSGFDKRDLCHLTLLCHSFKLLAQAFLFEEVVISLESLQSLLKSVEVTSTRSSPKRALYLHRFQERLEFITSSRIAPAHQQQSTIPFRRFRRHVKCHQQTFRGLPTLPKPQDDL